MSRMLVLQATIFILMALGFFYKKKKIISREGQKNITDLVIYLILPCNIITSFLSELPGDAMAAALQILLISLVIQIIAVIYGKVDAATAKEIVEKHIVGKELVDSKICDKPSIDIIKEN